MVILNLAHGGFWKTSSGTELAGRTQVTNTRSRPLLSCSLYVGWGCKSQSAFVFRTFVLRTFVHVMKMKLE